MHLEWLQLKHLRNLEDARITPGPRLNFITGRNASGKTSLLEAVYLLGRAKSFRTPRLKEVIRRDQDRFQVTGVFTHEQVGRIQVGLERGDESFEIRRNGETVRTLSELSQQMPLILVSQDSHLLVTGAPRERRHWLDWALFHVEPTYLGLWKTYVRAWRQRNALLKNQVSNKDLYRAWEQGMVECANELTGYREHFLQDLAAVLEGLSRDLFDEPVRLELYPGWTGDRLDAILGDSRETDRKAGYTRYGPHHADVRVTVQGKGLTSRFSRGQIKLFVTFLLLAQATVQSRMTGTQPILLFDDYQAELDAYVSMRLLTYLSNQINQVFLTTVDLGSDNPPPGARLFHVERGRLTDI